MVSSFTEFHSATHNAAWPFALSGEFSHSREINIGGEIRDVNFRIVEDADKLRAAHDLLNDRYDWRGYGSTHSIPTGPHHTTFTANIDETVVGTITLAVDSGSGLAVDNTFQNEMDTARREGASVCELTRLAFEPSLRSKEVMAGLFNLAFIYGTAVRDCSALFIEVAPRHTFFYETMLGFKRVGALGENTSVGSPAQLMRLEVDAIQRNIRRETGASDASQRRSLYPYFLDAEQELEVRRSLILNSKMRSFLNEYHSDASIRNSNSLRNQNETRMAAIQTNMSKRRAA